jgi:hypothetical protein
MAEEAKRETGMNWGKNHRANERMERIKIKPNPNQIN